MESMRLTQTKLIALASSVFMLTAITLSDEKIATVAGWHYLSNVTCLIRLHLFYACFVVSRITIMCYIIRHF